MCAHVTRPCTWDRDNPPRDCARDHASADVTHPCTWYPGTLHRDCVRDRASVNVRVIHVCNLSPCIPWRAVLVHAL